MLARPPALPPGMPDPPSPLPALPDPEAVCGRLRGSALAAEIVYLASTVLAHRFPLLASAIDTGPHIDWRRDYLHDISTGLAWFRSVPYLDFARAGDHKVVWELNRHQHLVLLAQAFRLTGRREFLDEIERQIAGWTAANPWLRGINWTSALEVAFRALSWIWLYHLAGARLSPRTRGLLLEGLHRHGCYLERNLSIYFSPNTHLLGEAVALHALGALFPKFPYAARWTAAGGRIVREQMDAQVRDDGSHFEQSSYYHVYALDFFLLHRALAGPSPGFDDKLRRMAGYLHALMGPARTLPFLGDDDGGRLFHPYGDRARFGRATLATAGFPADAADLEPQALWWLGAEPAPSPAPPLRSRLFPQAGTAVLIDGDLHVVMKAGPFGPGSGGHSHADLLSLVIRLGDEQVLLDPGTYTYVADPALRDWFRGTAAHNTVRIDGRDQAQPAGPFRWSGPPEVEIREWISKPRHDYLDAACRYAGFTHRRRVLLVKPDLLFVLDRIEGPPGEHLLEQYWHPGQGSERRIALPAAPETVDGWRSLGFGHKEPLPALCVRRAARLPAHLAAAIDCSPEPRAPELAVAEENGAIILRARDIQARFEPAGLPRYEIVRG